MYVFQKFIEISTASLERSNVCSIFNKIVGCELQGLNFVEILVDLRQLFLATYSQKKPVVKFVYSRLSVCTLQASNFTKIVSIIDAFLGISQTFTINYS